MSARTKTTLSKDAIAVLQDLIQINIDSRDGFNEAIEKIDVVSLSATFEQIARQRNDQISELRTLVAANAEEPEKKGSVPAAMHRAWMDLRSVLGGGATAILSEAERGEDHIKAKYEEALKSKDVAAVRDVIERQYVAVKKSHDRIRDLRDEHQNA